MSEPKTTRHQVPSHTKNQFVGAVIAGANVADAAVTFGIKRTTAMKIWRKYEETGSVENKPRSGRPPKLVFDHNTVVYVLYGRRY